MLAAVMPLGAYGQTRDLARVHACLELIEQRTAALVVQDWRRLEYLAKRYIDTCSSVFGLEELSDAHLSIAAAQLHTGRYENGVRAGDDCIRVFYSNPGCHLIKSEALIALKRFNEARAALELTERLTEHLLDEAARELATAKGEDKPLSQARINELKAISRRAEQLRIEHF